MPIFSGPWFDQTGNLTRVYRFSSRRSIQSITDQYMQNVTTAVSQHLKRQRFTISAFTYKETTAFLLFAKIIDHLKYLQIADSLIVFNLHQVIKLSNTHNFGHINNWIVFPH